MSSLVKVSRNDPCPCGSRRKYKRCCYANADLDDARTKIETWRIDYNEVRPHSALGNRIPAE